MQLSRVRLGLVILITTLGAGGCGHSITAPTAPGTPAAPTIRAPQLEIAGQNEQFLGSLFICRSVEEFYRSWDVIVHDSGAVGVSLRATVRTDPTATACDAAAFGPARELRPYVKSAYAPGETGSTIYLLTEHQPCGVARYELWAGSERIGYTQVAHPRACGEK